MIFPRGDVLNEVIEEMIGESEERGRFLSRRGVFQNIDGFQNDMQEYNS